MGDIFRRNKNLRRPRKTGTAKKRRATTQKRRLIKLGASEEKVLKMNSKEIRTLLRKPKKISRSKPRS